MISKKNLKHLYFRLMDSNQLKEISESSVNIKLGVNNGYLVKKKCC
jgi:hypothetical protein